MRRLTSLGLGLCVTAFTFGLTMSPVLAKSKDCAITTERNNKKYATLQAAHDAAGTNDTITVTGTCVGTTVVTKSLTITGSTGKHVAGPPVLDGGALGTTLAISGEVTVTINDLTIENGATSGDGGGISSELATVTVNNSAVTGNTGGLGGGIVVVRGSMTLNNSTVAGNGAYRGGGIFVYTGVLTLNDSTVRVNNAALRGGGIELLDPADGGGFDLGFVVLNNSAVTNNTPENCYGPFACSP
jgi:hypothetical protein